MISQYNYSPYQCELNLPVRIERLGTDALLVDEPSLKFGALRLCKNFLSSPFNDRYVRVIGTFNGSLIVEPNGKMPTCRFTKFISCVLKVALWATIILPILAAIGSLIFSHNNPMQIRKLEVEAQDKFLTVGSDTCSGKQHEEIQEKLVDDFEIVVLCLPDEKTILNEVHSCDRGLLIQVMKRYIQIKLSLPYEELSDSKKKLLREFLDKLEATHIT